MTDKEKIRAELERRMYDDYNSGEAEVDCVAQGVCASIIQFIDSMQEEPVKIKKGCKYRCLSDMVNNDTGKLSFIRGKIYLAPEDNTLVSEENGWRCDTSENSSNFELVEEPVSESLESFAKREADLFAEREYECDSYDRGFLSKGFYWGCKQGANWQKQQMMKDAVDVEVKIDAGGYLYIPAIEFYDYDKDVPLAKEGDKYKVILIKE